MLNDAKNEKYVSHFLSSELYSRELLDVYLSRALNVDLEDGRLAAIDDSAYVLTLDYTIKMLNIHERSVPQSVFFLSSRKFYMSIMVYGSTPYVGMVPKKNGGHIKSS